MDRAAHDEAGLLADLRMWINQKQAVVGVIGLGYVGLPVAAAFAQAGFRVIGVDIQSERVEVINAGQSPIEGDEPGLSDLLEEVAKSERFRATTNYSELAAADIILIDVETPVDEDHKPQYVALKSACRSIGRIMKSGTLVIVESTVAPGTVDKVVRPLLEEHSGFVADRDFFTGSCPERVMPGKLLANLQQMSRVCGGSTPGTSVTMAQFYKHIVNADLDLADAVTAELVKTTENAYRDVQIAFANEVALICEAVGADVWRVRELVNKVPSRQMHLPGAGVGGHCIPKDPWLLVYGTGDGALVRLIPQARAVNDYMPLHMAKLTVDALGEAGIPVETARVAVLGYSYLENSDDTRNSPSAVLVERLLELGAEVVIHDPWVEVYKGDIYHLAEGCDAVVIMVAHDVYSDLDLAALKSTLKTPVLVAGRRVVTRTEADKDGFIYRGVGEG